jgi:hypothetical protein
VAAVQRRSLTPSMSIYQSINHTLRHQNLKSHSVIFSAALNVNCSIVLLTMQAAIFIKQLLGL